MVSRIPILLVSLPLPLSLSSFSHRDDSYRNVAECCSPALWEFVSLSQTGQERKFFCSNRWLIICYAQVLTSALLRLCASFWHCIIQSIWHWTGENENTRKQIPQNINFVSQTALQNVARGRESSSSFCFTDQITVTLEIFNLVHLKSVCATKPEVWYRLFLLCVVVTNPFNEELLALKRFYL